MEQDELKRKLMGLWEKTTHNSKELVSTLFDYYFEMEYIEYKEVEGKVVSALFGIPYSFGFGKHYLKGLYIISLSSEEGFRKKGILAELLNNFNDRVKQNFDFTFLVPHTELLADYFGTQGYLSSFFILEERYTPLHDFKNDYMLSLTDSDDHIRELKIVLMDEIKVISNDAGTYSKEQIINFIEKIEKKGSSAINLTHTDTDLKYILEEENLRHLHCFISYDIDHKITGIAFTQKDDLMRIKVVANYISDPCSYYALLDFIKRKYPEYSITVVTSDPKNQTHSIIQQTYASSNPMGGDLDNTYGTVEIPFNINKLLQPLGMVRLLRLDSIINYVALSRSDIEFKLYIRDYNSAKKTIEEDYKDVEKNLKTIYVVKNGKCRVEYRSLEDINKDRNILNLSIKEISELLLRKNDSSNLIMEAFGIPRLNLQMRLLPY